MIGAIGAAGPALDALGGLTGGNAGPSSAGSTTNNDNAFNGGTVNFGSNNGVPSWVLIGGGLLAAYFLFGRNKRGKN